MAYQRNGGGQYDNRNGNGGNYGGGYQGQRQQRDQNGPASRRQREILQDYGYNPNVSFAQASQIIGQLKANGWQRNDAPQGGYQQPQGYVPQAAPPQQYPQQTQYQPAQQGGNQSQTRDNRCTQRQSEVLKNFNYDTSNMSFDEARAILDELAANGWQRNDGVQQGGNFGGHQPQVQGFDNGGSY